MTFQERAKKEWDEHKRKRLEMREPTKDEIHHAKAFLPDFTLDDDWPDMQDRLSSSLMEEFELDDYTADFLAEKLMVHVYSGGK
jgi:hypothetical protein